MIPHHNPAESGHDTATPSSKKAALAAGERVQSPAEPDPGGPYIRICGGPGRAALLEAGADPNATNLAGHTPLFNAVMAGNAQMVKALMGAGAQPDRTTKLMAKNKPEIKKLLRSR